MIKKLLSLTIIAIAISIMALFVANNRKNYPVNYSSCGKEVVDLFCVE